MNLSTIENSGRVMTRHVLIVVLTLWLPPGGPSAQAIRDQTSALTPHPASPNQALTLDSRQRDDETEDIHQRPSDSGAALGPSAVLAAQQPNLARPRPDPKWAASFVVGTTSSGPANDLEDAMRAAQFDESRGACIFGLCFPGTEHPFSNTGFGAIGFPWAVSSRRWLSPWYGIGVSGGVAEIGETLGQRRDSVEYLDVRYRVATLAPLFTVRPVRGLHAGIGPALFTTTFTAGSLSPPPEFPQKQTRRKAGLLWEIGVSAPPRSRLYGEFLAQYRHVGRVGAGPFVTMNGFTGETSTLPVTNVHVSHWFVGVGAGVRF